MAHVPFALQRFHETHHAGGYISWFKYATTHTKAELLAANFFNESVDTLNVGDIVEALADTDGTPELVDIRIATNDGTNVTTTELI